MPSPLRKLLVRLDDERLIYITGNDQKGDRIYLGRPPQLVSIPWVCSRYSPGTGHAQVETDLFTVSFTADTPTPAAMVTWGPGGYHPDAPGEFAAPMPLADWDITETSGGAFALDLYHRTP